MNLLHIVRYAEVCDATGVAMQYECRAHKTKAAEKSAAFARSKK